MSENGYSRLLRPGEIVADIDPAEHGSQEWAFGYGFNEIQNSTHEAGNSVLLDIEPQGAVEPVLITGDITLTVTTLQGRGWAIVYNTETNEDIRVVGLSPSKDPLVLVKGDAYYYINSGDDHLILRDDSTPAFKNGDEVQLTFVPEQGEDGTTIELPSMFWRVFDLAK